jgi:hypothetical protein
MMASAWEGSRVMPPILISSGAKVFRDGEPGCAAGDDAIRAVIPPRNFISPADTVSPAKRLQNMA